MRSCSPSLLLWLTAISYSSAIELYDHGCRMLDTSFDFLARGALSGLRVAAVRALESR
jgi:hypothetical protein